MNIIDNIEQSEAQSVTAAVCENAALYGAAPERDEFDIGNRSLPVALLPALARALLRSPPALRSSLPYAVRSAPSAAQSPRRLRSAGFTGVDLPIFHTARIVCLTARGGLGFHTPRIGDAGGAMEPYVLPFRGLSRSNGVLRLLDRACIGPIHANRHRPVPA